MNIAHINPNNNTEQTVENHCTNVKTICKKYVSSMKLSAIAELQGLLHDIGKCCRIFEAYIKNESNMKRGSIDHSYAGAKYICEIADSMGENFYCVSRFIAHTIVSHHGLHDWYNSNEKDYLRTCPHRKNMI